MSGNIYAKVLKLAPSIARVPTTRNLYKKISYSNIQMFNYPTEEIDDPEFYPAKLDFAVFFYPISETDTYKVVANRPSFIDPNSWNEISKYASAFLSSNKTIMPRIVFPNKQICDNGIVLSAEKGPHCVNPDSYKTTFNWDRTEVVDTTPPLADDSKWGERDENKSGSNFGYVNMSKVINSLELRKNLTRVYTLINKEAMTSDNYTVPLIGDGGDGGGAACAFTFSFLDPVYGGGNQATDGVTPKLTITMGNVELSMEKGGNIVVSLDGSSKTDAGLTKSQASIMPGQANGRPETFVLLTLPVWNGITCSSGVQDSKNVVDNGFYCIKNANNNISEYCHPPLNEFDFENPTDIEILYPNDVKTNWGENVTMQWTKAVGTFSYTPAFFIPYSRWTVFFRELASSEDYSYEYYLYNMTTYNGSHSNIEVLNEKATPVPGSETDDGYMYYRVDVQITPASGFENKYQRRGLESWGFLLRTKETQQFPRVKNANGDFGMIFGDGAVSLNDWFEYMTELNVNISEDSSGGSMVFDKYAMMGQDNKPDQRIGGIRIEMYGGNESVLKPGIIFGGIAMEISDNLSSGSDSLSVALFGLEKKLEDIKIINAPFWDGDSVSTVANWLSAYGGIEIKFPAGYSNPNAPLPRSFDFEKPAVNFPMGTSVIEALRKIALYSDHLFVIQKDGIGYFYSFNEYGIPRIAYTGKVHNYNSTDVISVNNQPTFSNLYNAYMTVGLLGTSDGKRHPMTMDVLPFMMFDHTSPKPNLPWSKLWVTGEQGFLTKEQLLKLHNTYKKAYSQYEMTGSITVPGNSEMNLFDRIKIDENEYYIHSISHSANFQSKDWTTTVQVSKTV